MKILEFLKKHQNTLAAQLILSLLSALLLILSMPTYGYSFLAFIAYIPIIYAMRIEGARPIIAGTLFGFTFWVISLAWMMNTFGYFGGAPIYGALFILVCISLTGGFICTMPYTLVAKKFKNSMLIAVSIVMLEAFKSSFVFGGLPWLNLAQSQYQNITILQFVSFFGEYGLSFMIALINILILYSILYRKRKYYISLVVAIAIMLLPGIARKIKPMQFDDYINIAIIQSGYDQDTKWAIDKAHNIIAHVNNMLSAASKTDADLLILPESTYPISPIRVKWVMNELKNAVQGKPTIFGADRVEIDNETNRYYNSMVLLSDNTTQRYDKRRLTPFGEYFPLMTILRPAKEFFFGKGEMYTPGAAQQKMMELEIKGKKVKIAPIICFESAFTNLLIPYIEEGANIITIITNDTWFGNLKGRMQHLAVDTMRAVEYNRAIAKSTQDGISAFIMPNGAIIMKEERPIPATLLNKLPLYEARSLYSYIGNMWLLILIGVIYIEIKLRKRRKASDEV